MYSWNGSWSVQQDTRQWAATPATLRVLTTEGFFAVWCQDAHSDQCRLHLVRAEPFRFGEWERDTYPVTLAEPMTAPVVSVAAVSSPSRTPKPGS